jgi:hypothetical protein
MLKESETKLRNDIFDLISLKNIFMNTITMKL